MNVNNPTGAERRIRPIWHAVWIALALLAGPGTAAAVSTFNSGAEGWTSVGFQNVANYPLFPTAVTTSSVDYNAAGGNPGGYISKADPDGNWQYFSAPGMFLGNQSSAVGQNLTFDELILNTFGQPALDPQGPLVAISAGAITLVYGGGSSTPAISGTGWNSLTVALVAGSWRIGTPTGAVATSVQFNSVMSNLTGLYILSDFWTGSGGNGEIVGLDNVSLPVAVSAVPEPATVLSLLAGGVLLLTVRKAERHCPDHCQA